jgi:hypothetical protein
MDNFDFHFVGSLPPSLAPSAQEAFRVMLDRAGQQVKRLPDGEFGERHYFVLFQEKVFSSYMLKRCNYLAMGTG